MHKDFGASHSLSWGPHSLLVSQEFGSKDIAFERYNKTEIAETIKTSNKMGHIRGNTQARGIENLNSSAPKLHHKKDCHCQVGKWENNDLGQMGTNKTPALMLEVVGRGR